MSIQLTAAQLEKQAARRAAKLVQAENGLTAAARPAPKLSPEEIERRRFLKREWLDLPGTNSAQVTRKAKIVSWNVSTLKGAEGRSSQGQRLTVVACPDACA